MISAVLIVLIVILTGFVLLSAAAGYFARGNTEAMGYYLLSGVASVLAVLLALCL